MMLLLKLCFFIIISTFQSLSSISLFSSFSFEFSAFTESKKTLSIVYSQIGEITQT